VDKTILRELTENSELEYMDDFLLEEIELAIKNLKTNNQHQTKTTSWQKCSRQQQKHRPR